MVEPNEDPNLPGDSTPPPTEHEIVMTSVDSNEMMNTLLFWLLFVAVVFMIGRYSDQIAEFFRRLLGMTSQEHQKLSGGDENRQDSLG